MAAVVASAYKYFIYTKASGNVTQSFLCEVIANGKMCEACDISQLNCWYFFREKTKACATANDTKLVHHVLHCTAAGETGCR